MFVFLNAVDGGIEVSVDKKYVGYACDAEQLAEVFTSNNISEADDIYCSSSIDFASEEGFETDEDAHAIIQEALEILHA